jgi:hypothetical protein
MWVFMKLISTGGNCRPSAPNLASHESRDTSHESQLFPHHGANPVDVALAHGA